MITKCQKLPRQQYNMCWRGPPCRIGGGPFSPPDHLYNLGLLLRTQLWSPTANASFGTSSCDAVDRTTVTAAAQVLFRRNLLKFEVHPTDRRNKVLKLTSEGMRVLAEAVPIWTREHNRLEREMLAGVPERLRGDLQLLRRQSSDDSPGTGNTEGFT